MVFDIFTGAVSNTTGTPFNPAVAATVVSSASIVENAFDYIIVCGMLTIVQTGTASTQVLNFDIIDAAGPTTLVTIPYTGSAVAKSDVLTFIVPIRKNTKGTIQLSLRGATVDAQTTITAKTFLLVGADVGRGASGL